MKKKKKNQERAVSESSGKGITEGRFYLHRDFEVVAHGRVAPIVGDDVEDIAVLLLAVQLFLQPQVDGAAAVGVGGRVDAEHVQSWRRVVVADCELRV